MKRIGKGLNKVFKVLVRELKKLLPAIVELGSEASHFTPEPRNFSEVAILPTEAKKAWTKSTLKEIKNPIDNQTFLMEHPSKR